ncbi:hypothetical protein M758_UG045200 [Ceratodon purpureus]|nr:hypothetical protein M758_UG045200 [Ceratodon purpureus]
MLHSTLMIMELGQVLPLQQWRRAQRQGTPSIDRPGGKEDWDSRVSFERRYTL